jgi:hypothetical protein
MRANKKGELLLLVDDEKHLVPSMPKFKRFLGAFGWPDRHRQKQYAQHWLSLIGEQEDNVLRVFAESCGDLYGVGKTAIDMKDLYFADSFYVKSGELHNQAIRELRTLEGLTYYKSEQDILGRRRWITDAATWPHFRDYTTVASVVGVSDNVAADMLSGFQQIKWLASQGKLLVRGVCMESLFLIRDAKPPYDELLNHPLAQALVFTVSMLLRTRPVEGMKREKQRILYPNRKR